MIKHPPHLPQKTCSVKQHENLCTLKIFVLYVIISFVSGIAGALVTFAWIVPNYNNSDFYLFKYNNPEFNQNEIADSILTKKFQYNTVKIFDKSGLIYENFYSENSFVDRAVLLSSNGWTVLFDPDFNYNKIKNWAVIDYRGLEHKIERAIFDSENGFVYVKLQGDEFHVVSFADLNNFDINDKIWLGGKNNLKRVIISGKEEKTQNFYWASESALKFKINENDYSAKLLFDDQGKLLGFLNKDLNIKSIWKVEKDLNNILANSVLSDLSIDFKGHFVKQESEAISENEDQNLIEGFYVSQLKKYISKDYVQVGDIILEINGKKITKENLAYQIYNLGENHNLKVWRKGEMIIINSGFQN
ncbi:MAG: hypothetical protein WC414_01705 [Patescibacteria group bacterium]